uniref:Uncharacterized protein n=1 Tax=Solanum tuberosum TaxID=4113 RepID=M1DZI4_SOLTU
MKANYLRDDAAWRKPPPPNTTPVVDPLPWLLRPPHPLLLWRSQESDENESRREEDEQKIALTLTEFLDTKKVIVQATLERSLPETSVVATSGVSLDSTIPPVIL